jgi:hypothetical protein
MPNNIIDIDCNLAANGLDRQAALMRYPELQHTDVMTKTAYRFWRQNEKSPLVGEWGHSG